MRIKKWVPPPKDQPRDEKSRHNEKFLKTGCQLGTNKWNRKSFGEEARKDGLRENAETEIDRDMYKPVQQLACDIHETYLRWEEKSKMRSVGSPSASEMEAPVHFILFALSRTASMNAKVARRMEILTSWIAILTFVLVAMEFIHLFKPW